MGAAQNPFKAYNLCFTKISLILQMNNKSTHLMTKKKKKTKTNKTNHNESKRAVSAGGREGVGKAGAGVDGVLTAGWQCLSLEGAQLAWGCSRWLFLRTS